MWAPSGHPEVSEDLRSGGGGTLKAQSEGKAVLVGCPVLSGPMVGGWVCAAEAGPSSGLQMQAHSQECNR